MNLIQVGLKSKLVSSGLCGPQYSGHNLFNIWENRAPSALFLNTKLQWVPDLMQNWGQECLESFLGKSGWRLVDSDICDSFQFCLFAIFD